MEKGDRIICVNSSGANSLERNKIYTVKKCEGGWVFVEELPLLKSGGWHRERFELYETKQTLSTPDAYSDAIEGQDIFDQLEAAKHKLGT